MLSQILLWWVYTVSFAVSVMCRALDVSIGISKDYYRFVGLTSFFVLFMWIEVSGRVDRALWWSTSVVMVHNWLVVEWIERLLLCTEAVDLGSIPGPVKPKTIKIGIHSFPAWRSEASSVCGKQVGRWQLDSKTQRFLRCLLAMATWWIKCNYRTLHYIPFVATGLTKQFTAVAVGLMLADFLTLQNFCQRTLNPNPGNSSYFWSEHACSFFLKLVRSTKLLLSSNWKFLSWLGLVLVLTPGIGM